MNTEKEAIDVYWSQLKSADKYSVYKRECPFCENGMLLLGRNRETMQLDEYDRCIGCRQRIRYLDIEKLRAREQPGVPIFLKERVSGQRLQHKVHGLSRKMKQ